MKEKEEAHRIGIDPNRGLILLLSGTIIMILSQGNNTDSLADLFQYARCCMLRPRTIRNQISRKLL